MSADSLIPNFRDPQDLNRYAYCGNDPTTCVDPTGHFGWKSVVKAVKVTARVAVNVAAAVAPVTGPVGAALIGGAASIADQYLATGHVNWQQVGMDAAMNVAGAGAGAILARGGRAVSEALPEIRSAVRAIHEGEEGAVRLSRDAQDFGRIPDDALVVRGGRNTPASLESGTGTLPSGITGVSVQSAPGLSWDELVEAGRIEHGQIGVTTAGAVREAGDTVIRTPGIGYHCTIPCGGPGDISYEDLSRLFQADPPIENPYADFFF